MSTEKKAIAHFTRPWPDRRGLESFESHAGSILVRVSIDELADAIAPYATEVRRDVLGDEIEVSGCFLFAFQLVGHQWSAILPNLVLNLPGLYCSLPPEAQLSKLVGQPVIKLFMGDGFLGYKLFEPDGIIEYFVGSGGEPFDREKEPGIPIQRSEVTYPCEDEDEPDSVQIIDFWSRDRSLTAAALNNRWTTGHRSITDNRWTFPDQCLRKYDAYDPGLDFRYFLENGWSLRRGMTYKTCNPGVTLSTGRREATAIPEFVRVDYFRFGS